jgi:predicted nucleic acid-binding protein
MSHLIQYYGIDTSVFLRLLTGHPEKDFRETAASLAQLMRNDPNVEIVVSNQVIGEAYVVLQHFYQVSKLEARNAILKVLKGGNVVPLNGRPVLSLLAKKTSAGLVDILIAQDYAKEARVVLTNDRRMAKLPGVQLLSAAASK